MSKHKYQFVFDVTGIDRLGAPIFTDVAYADPQREGALEGYIERMSAKYPLIVMFQCNVFINGNRSLVDTLWNAQQSSKGQ